MQINYSIIRNAAKFKAFLEMSGNISNHTTGLKTFFIIACLGMCFCHVNCRSTPAVNKDLSAVRSPVEEVSTFQLPSDLKIQLVAAEPLVQDPVAISFDPDGRLWVVEMRGFMADIDGKGEKERTGRVSVLQDTDGDGRMDIRSTYIDSLVMPRAIALVPRGALIVENQALWLTQDLDGDLKADSKILLDSAYAGGSSPEHSANGLLRNIDNWYYNARSRFRYRLREGQWQRDSTEFRGQWGICHDDEGRLYYNYNWSQLHADLVPPDYFSRNKNHTPTTGIDHGLTTDRKVYPIRPTPAVNRGYIPGTLDKEGRLLEFTAACAPFFYREAALPKEYYGNVFVCEPAGNLIRRNIVEEKGLLLTAHDATPGKEFLASADERFRPVYLASGADGALYIVDMYKGIIQYGSYMTPYLREQTIKRKLTQPIHCGRIWRVVPQNWKPPVATKLSTLSSGELIAILSDLNGWRRDMAQRLLVERGDKTAGRPLTDLALNGSNNLARLHALWTLEGLQLTRPEALFQLLQDRSPLISTTAVRLLEPIAKVNKDVRKKFENELITLWGNAPDKQMLQISLAAGILDPEISHRLLRKIAERYDTSVLFRDAILSSLSGQEFVFLKNLWQLPSWQNREPSKEIFIEMLATAIVHRRNPAELASVLSMLNVKKDFLTWKQKAVLAGISVFGKNGKMIPIRLRSAPAILTRRDVKDLPSEIPVLRAMFEWPGHIPDSNSIKLPHPLTESEQKQFVAGRQLYLTTCAACHGTDGAGMNRFAPPLSGSDWVLGDAKRLILILLQGMEGAVQVNGKSYGIPDVLPVMPAHFTLDDGSISAILTYIRNEWNNVAAPVSTGMVSTTRVTSQGRIVPWTAIELNKHMLQTNTNNNK